MLHHAAIFGTKQLKPLVLNGFEIQPETYVRLLSNLRRELGEKGWDASEDSAPCWQIGSAVAQYHCADASKCSPEPEVSQSTSAAFVYNDPNSIAEWCLTEALFHIAQSSLHPCQRLDVTQMDLSDCRGKKESFGLKGPN